MDAVFGAALSRGLTKGHALVGEVEVLLLLHLRLMVKLLVGMHLLVHGLVLLLMVFLLHLRMLLVLLLHLLMLLVLLLHLRMRLTLVLLLLLLLLLHLGMRLVLILSLLRHRLLDGVGVCHAVTICRTRHSILYRLCLLSCSCSLAYTDGRQTICWRRLRNGRWNRNLRIHGSTVPGVGVGVEVDNPMGECRHVGCFSRPSLKEV